MEQTRREFLQNNNHLPGTWKGLRLSNGEKSASFTCPDCGNIGALVDHEIQPDGKVNPSVVCPTQGCAFHEFVLLKDWTV